MQVFSQNIPYFNYIPASDGFTAIVVTQNSQSSKTYFTYKDNLGSIVALTNENGDVIYKQNFDAWGRRRNPGDWTYSNITPPPSWLRGYTGHEHLPNFHLINMNGRMYAPLIARMLSPDNFVQDATFTQNFNRYSYVYNNPLKYNDPSGEFVVAPLIIGAVVGAISGWHIGKSLGMSGGDLAGFSFVGAIFGGVSGGIGLGVATGTSVAIGGVMGGMIGTTIGSSIAGGINGLGLTTLMGGNGINGFLEGAIGGLSSGAMLSGLGLIAPSFQNTNTFNKYLGKALYAGFVGSSSNGFGMLISDLADDGRLNNDKRDYFQSLKSGMFLGTIVSLGYSSYDFFMWDRFSNFEKVEILNKIFDTDVISYDSDNPDYGGYHWGTNDIELGDVALKNRAIALNTVSHEFQHYHDFFNGIPFNRRNLEIRAYTLDMSLAPSQGLPGRYWIESRNNLQNLFHFNGLYPHSFGPGQIWFNIFR